MTDYWPLLQNVIMGKFSNNQYCKTKVKILIDRANFLVRKIHEKRTRASFDKAELSSLVWALNVLQDSNAAFFTKEQSNRMLLLSHDYINLVEKEREDKDEHGNKSQVQRIVDRWS